MTKIDIGNTGEALARNYIEQRGYTIIETNWHCQYGEIDIIARHQKQLIFIEVRTRQASNTEMALASITARKKQRFIKTIYSYLAATKNDSTPWRADIIGVALQAGQEAIIDHVEDALDW